MLVIALTILSAAIGEAGASETYRCWTHSATARQTLSAEVIWCRIGESALADYRSVADVLVALYPAVGQDFVGRCWYHREAPTTLQAVSMADDGAALLIDYSISGSPFEVGVVRRCRSEVAASASSEVVWAFLRNAGFVHPEPRITPARGVAGLPSYLHLELPARETVHVYDSERRLVIAVDIEVGGVLVDRGEGAGPNRFEVDDARALAGYPTGRALHRYESAAMHRVSVIFEWRVSWETGPCSRREVAVPPTGGGSWYEVDEIVARIVG